MSLVELPDFVGIIGVSLVLLAYYLLQIGSIKGEDYLYSLLNLCGATFILVSLYFHWNLASVIIEIAWIIISFLGLWRRISYKTKSLLN